MLDSDTAETAIDTRKNQVAADITKKLREDPTRGGLAAETMVLDYSSFEDAQKHPLTVPA